MLDLVAATSTKGPIIKAKGGSADGGTGGGNKNNTIGTVLQELDSGMTDCFDALLPTRWRWATTCRRQRSASTLRSNG
jgi:hypothetical protein